VNKYVAIGGLILLGIIIGACAGFGKFRVGPPDEEAKKLQEEVASLKQELKKTQDERDHYKQEADKPVNAVDEAMRRREVAISASKRELERIREETGLMPLLDQNKKLAEQLVSLREENRKLTEKLIERRPPEVVRVGVSGSLFDDLKKIKALRKEKEKLREEIMAFDKRNGRSYIWGSPDMKEKLAVERLRMAEAWTEKDIEVNLLFDRMIDQVNSR